MTNSYLASDLLSAVKGIGPVLQEKLQHLSLITVGDLLLHYPHRYLDFTQQTPIGHLKAKRSSSFLAQVTSPKTFFSKTGKLITQATARDASGKITLTWFNNPYIKKLIVTDETYSIAGTPTFFGSGLTLISPILEPGNSFTLNTHGLVPIYPQTEGITSRWLRKIIYHILQNIDLADPIDQDLLLQNKLLPLYQAVYNIHFPPEKKLRLKADRRLSYNEHLRINLQNRLELLKLGNSIALKIDSGLNKKATQKLPFILTPDQIKTIHHLEKDLTQKEFTHRLIQGDTGSGKTATIILAANQCLANSQSCALLAPTEILANQHFATFQKFSLFPKNICLVTGRNKAHFTHKPTIFIGTHALLTQIPENIKPSLAFVAIDEQHKFGVAQRASLLQRVPVPHLFNLSATPIPRTVALGLLGDIQISNLNRQSLNRLPTKTFVISPTKFKKSPQWLISQLEEGNQIFVVCPNIYDHINDVNSVQKLALYYRQILPIKYPILTLHGQMAGNDQQTVLTRFKDTPGSVLVATSLIEVGIDIPAANIMIIHSAERFGLAQLHQLRGRVGRGQGQGYCFLVTSHDDEIETERLQLLSKYHSGLTLAKKDLKIRGAGEVFGEKQHGTLATSLKYFWSRKLFLQSKSDALRLIQENPTSAKKIATSLQTW